MTSLFKIKTLLLLKNKVPNGSNGNRKIQFLFIAYKINGKLVNQDFEKKNIRRLTTDKANIDHK